MPPRPENNRDPVDEMRALHSDTPLSTLKCLPHFMSAIEVSFILKSLEESPTPYPTFIFYLLSIYLVLDAQTTSPHQQ